MPVSKDVDHDPGHHGGELYVSGRRLRRQEREVIGLGAHGQDADRFEAGVQDRRRDEDAQISVAGLLLGSEAVGRIVHGLTLSADVGVGGERCAGGSLADLPALGWRGARRLELRREEPTRRIGQEEPDLTVLGQTRPFRMEEGLEDPLSRCDAGVPSSPATRRQELLDARPGSRAERPLGRHVTQTRQNLRKDADIAG